jgi:hypothetical protein
MAMPLNLTLARGPSVWDEQPSGHTHWRIYGVAAGAALAGFATRRRAEHPWLLGLGLGVILASLLGERISSKVASVYRQLVDRDASREIAIDRALEDSFPASDPSQFL